MSSAGLVPTYAAPKKLAAFAAQRDTVAKVAGDDDQTQVQTELIYRDAYGRTRIESGSIVTLIDTITHSSTLMNVKRKTYFTTAWASTNPQETRTTDVGGGARVEQLGARTITGRAATGIAYSDEIPVGAEFGNTTAIRSRTEVWTAKDVLVPVLVNYADTEGNSIESRYSRIDVKDNVDPTLFSVPAGYSLAASDGDVTEDLDTTSGCNSLWVSRLDLYGDHFGGSTTYPNGPVWCSAPCKLSDFSADYYWPLDRARVARDAPPPNTTYVEFNYFDNNFSNDNRSVKARFIKANNGKKLVSIITLTISDFL